MKKRETEKYALDIILLTVGFPAAIYTPASCTMVVCSTNVGQKTFIKIMAESG